MISFATDFAVDPAHGPEDFLRAIASWLLDVERTAIAAEQLQALPTETSSRINTGGELLQTLIARQPDATVAGIRYSRQEEHLTWITTVVFSRRLKTRGNGAGNTDLPDMAIPETDTAPASDAWLGIRIECTSSLPQAHLPVDRDPAIVPALLNALGGGLDGPLRVSNQPRLLAGHELPLAADLILGNSDHRLPIVYVSACFQPGHAIDPRRLASRLAGRAHVVVEPGNSFSRQLQALTKSTNVYGGTVGIYWPEGGEPRRFYLGTLYQTAAELGDAIREDLHRTLRQRRPLPRCTWAHLREQVSQNTIAALKSAGSLSIDDCIRSFGEEIAAKEQLLQEAEEEIERLRQELRQREIRPGDDNILLSPGTERNFYDQEILGIVLDALADARKYVPPDSRRHHVLQSIVGANPLPHRTANAHRDALKNLLRGTSTLDARIRRGLESMGFRISNGGKHYKLVYQEDDRYTYTLPKSGSDHRGGLNAANDIGRLMF
jgi:hypothetical protein